MNSLAVLDDFDSYCKLFVNVELWTPYVQTVCQWHGLLPCETIRVGIPGTYPAFIVDERWVVKFFGKLFEGGKAFTVEHEAARLVEKDPAIPVARVAAAGELGGTDWHWPYLVFDFIKGTSIGEVRAELPAADRRRVAREVGELARRLHALQIADSLVFSNDHRGYLQFLEQQRAECVERHRKWGMLPPHLIDQIEDFLPPVESLIDTAHRPHLIHADLTRDHLLGRVENGHWQTLALIDFGDAMTGDLLYELAALSLDLLGGEEAAIQACLDAYGLPEEKRADLPRKALATALLHQFNVLENAPAEALQASSLEEAASIIW